MEGMFAGFFVNHQIEPALAQAVAARLVEEGAYATGPTLSSPFAEPSPWSLAVWDFATASGTGTRTNITAATLSPARAPFAPAGFDNLADLPSLTEEELKELGFEKMRPRKLAVRRSPAYLAVCARRLTPRSLGSWPR